MMKIWRDGWLARRWAVEPRGCIAALLCLRLVSVAADSVAASVPPSGSFLNDAWSFASGITNDPEDQARSQAAVVQAWLDVGQPTQAVALAANIQDWRRLAGYADAAGILARSGQTNEAVRWLQEAEYQAPGLTGWPYDRVQMHIAEAKAYLGRRGELALLARFYADHRECRGTVQAAIALEYLRAGRIEDALGAFDGLPESDLFDVAVARAASFRDLSEAGVLSPERRLAVLQRAWAEADKIPGWRRVDLQLELIEAARSAHAGATMRDWLDRVTREARTDVFPAFVRAGHLAKAAVCWGRLGDTGTVVSLEADFRAGPMKSIELIVQPEPLARFAEAHRYVGAAARSDALFAEAWAVASALTNPRPRALACIDVLLALARAGAPEETLQDQRKTALAGFISRAP